LIILSYSDQFTLQQIENSWKH